LKKIIQQLRRVVNFTGQASKGGRLLGGVQEKKADGIKRKALKIPGKQRKKQLWASLEGKEKGTGRGTLCGGGGGTRGRCFWGVLRAHEIMRFWKKGKGGSVGEERKGVKEPKDQRRKARIFLRGLIPPAFGRKGTERRNLHRPMPAHEHGHRLKKKKKRNGQKAQDETTRIGMVGRTARPTNEIVLGGFRKGWAKNGPNIFHRLRNRCGVKG